MPSLPEIMCRQFRLAVAGEDSLFVALYTQEALARRKVCEVFPPAAVFRSAPLQTAEIRTHASQEAPRSDRCVHDVSRHHTGAPRAVPLQRTERKISSAKRPIRSARGLQCSPSDRCRMKEPAWKAALPAAFHTIFLVCPPVFPAGLRSGALCPHDMQHLVLYLEFDFHSR